LDDRNFWGLWFNPHIIQFASARRPYLGDRRLVDILQDKFELAAQNRVTKLLDSSPSFARPQTTINPYAAGKAIANSKPAKLPSQPASTPKVRF